ncbi:unnamed protein product [Cylicostephanus goldi]|uniref:Uncharacterized protein n=1 Tax=Cylicostephanus goldi TaxID=71465 RepID=A0A3P7MA25_CYLGO|nr:unnamed protein product [Cylicostephanus goldi]
MAGESLRKKYQEFLLHQVFGDMIGSLYPEHHENRRNVQEAVDSENMGNVQEATGDFISPNIFIYEKRGRFNFQFLPVLLVASHAKTIGSLYPERNENRGNVQEAAVDSENMGNVQEATAEGGENHGRTGWTEEATEDGDWIVYHRGNL